MGRRKSSAGGSEYDAESMGSLEYGSKASGGGRRGRRDTEEELEVDEFDAAVEQLYEKRASTRESALTTIISLLSQFRYDDCAFREDTLTQLFLSCIRKGKEAEVCLAAKALGLHVTTLGTSTATEGIYQEAEAVLEPLVLTGKSTAARTAGVEALSLLCFVGSEGASDTLHTMRTLWRVVMGGWKKAVVAPAVVAALRGWAFLLTTVPSYRLDSHFVETHLGLLAQLLNGGDVDVRGAAGEAIALLWNMGDLSNLPESPRPSRSASNASAHNSLVAMAVGSPRTRRAGTAGAPFGSPGDGATNGQPAAAGIELRAAEAGPAEAAHASQQEQRQQLEQQQAQQQQEEQRQEEQHAQPAPQSQQSGRRVELEGGGDDGGDVDDDDEEEEEEEVDSLEAIVDRMRDLAKNRGDASRLNKGDRVASRGTFRDLLAIIQGDHVPEQKIKLRYGDTLLVTGLLDNIRLNYLRSYLADAFQSQLQSNELLHEVFRFQPADEPEARLTPQEKRMFRSKSSSDVRDRTELRKKERSQTARYQHGGTHGY